MAAFGHQPQRQRPQTSAWSECNARTTHGTDTVGYYSSALERNQRNAMKALQDPDCHESQFRRSFLLGAASAISFWASGQNRAWALKQKDELLCGTGFFTNIAQYKCTEIGDILDEGKPKEFNSKELDSMDALMGKMGMSTLDDDTKNDDQDGNDAKVESSASNKQ